jgi:hypothetical protein
MKNLRLILSGICVLGLGFGYAASQAAFFQGREAAAAYAIRSDSPMISTAAALLMLTALALAFVPGTGEDPEA